ncbi:MAG: hypothetical protein ABIP48_14115 [Planctomycetota bacterium]
MSNLFTLILCSTSLCAVESNVDDDRNTPIADYTQCLEQLVGRR